MAADALLSGSAASATVSLEPSVLNAFTPTAVFHNDGNAKLTAEERGDCKCNGLSFSDDGQYLAASFNDRVLQLVDVYTGTLEAVFSLKTSGVRSVTFTHHNRSVLHAAHKGKTGIISYHCVHTNKVLRLYNQHAAPVSTIAVNPASDQFLSASGDGMCCLWDLRSPNCTHSWYATSPAVGMRANGATNYKGGVPAGRACASFDGSGAIFAVAAPDHTVAMYDARRPEKPFAHRQVAVPSASTRVAGADAARPLTFHGLSFSPNGNLLAATTREHGCIVLDSAPHADSSQDLAEMTLAVTHVKTGCNAVFSADNRFLITGSETGDVWAYDMAEMPPEPTADEQQANAFSVMEYRTEMASWLPTGYTLGQAPAAPQLTGSESEAEAAALAAPPKHDSAVSAVAVHPDRAIIASADDTLALWMPAVGSVKPAA